MTEYSLLDGCFKVEDLIAHLPTINQDAVAITDHGVLFGAVKLTKEAKDRGIKPIIGFEGYVATTPDSTLPAKSGGDNYHITLLAQSREGYKNLMRLTTHGHLRGLSYKPRIDLGVLERYSAGVIVLSGCIGAQIPQLLVQGREKEAEEVARWFHAVFADRFFIEVMYHGATNGVDHTRATDKAGNVLMGESDLNAALVGLANKLGVGIVATNDAHYLKREHGCMQDTLLCLSTGKWKEETERMMFPGFKERAWEFYIKSEAEMLAACSEPWWISACANTRLVADMIAPDVIELGQSILPQFKIPHDPAFTLYQRTGVIL